MFQLENFLKKIDCFFDYPEKWYHLREYARLNNISSSVASKLLNDLNKEKYLIKKKEHNLTLYKANLDSEEFKELKIINSIKKIKKSKLIDFLSEELNSKCIILFGSTSKGNDNKNSDIDIFVVSPSKKEINVSKFEKILDKKIQLFIYNKLELIKNNNLANNIINGIILEGHIEVF